MPAAPRPSFEHDRLQALMSLKILDTAPSEYLDSLVSTASKMMEMPIAAISLIDEDRQWLKSGIGLPIEAPRDAAFCAYTILNPAKTLCVSDASADVRFSDNPLVIGRPYIRSYLGAPLLTKNGLPIGALCVIDIKPRNFTNADVERIENLARVVAICLRLHGTVQHLKKH